MEIRRSTLERMREEDLMMVSDDIDSDFLEEIDEEVESDKMSLTEAMFYLGTQ